MKNFYKRHTTLRVAVLVPSPTSQRFKISSKSASVSLRNLQIRMQWPKFSGSSLFLRGVRIRFIKENDLSTSAVDGGMRAASSNTDVMSG